MSTSNVVITYKIFNSGSITVNYGIHACMGVEFRLSMGNHDATQHDVKRLERDECISY